MQIAQQFFFIEKNVKKVMLMVFKVRTITKPSITKLSVTYSRISLLMLSNESAIDFFLQLISVDFFLHLVNKVANAMLQDGCSGINKQKPGFQTHTLLMVSNSLLIRCGGAPSCINQHSLVFRARMLGKKRLSQHLKIGPITSYP